MTPDDYSARDGIALAELIVRREVSAAEVVEAAIAEIERLNPRFNAVILKTFEAARAAGSAEGAKSRLIGVPFLLKDVNLYDREMPTRFASRYFRDARPRADSEMVARWRHAGLRILGKTNTPEFAGEFITEPVAYGPALNPWNTGRTVGGSSGGAGAAVASGMVPIAHGTDLGGSIRIPAACCGVFGFKPTARLNPLGPFFDEIAGGLDSDHVLTRTVRDSAAALDITANGPGGFLDGLARPPRHLRIGMTAISPEGVEAGPNQRAATERAAALLADLGHVVVDYRYPDEAAVGPWFDPLWMIDVHHLVAEHAAEIGRLPGPDELEPLSHAALEAIGRMSAADYFAARMAKQRAATALHRSMDRLDIVLTPSLASDPVPVGALAFTKFADLAAWGTAGYAFAPFSAPANIAGQPSASLPAAPSPAGLPVGIQVTGKPGADALVLRLCRQIEEAMPWPRLAPI
jgi:amidase